MSARSRILITVNGMGDPEAGHTFAWSESLFPDAVEGTATGRRWLETDDTRCYFLEVEYEDVNDALLAKHQGLRSLIPGDLTDAAAATLQEFVLDVVEQVLVKEALDAAQMRFLATYVDALALAHDLVGPGGDPRTVPIGVLAHSLGTLVAFEGLHRAADAEDIIDFVPVRLALCAPMLAPIHAVQSTLPDQGRRYLVARGPVKPTRYDAFHDAHVPVVPVCRLFYDTDDPFHLLHSDVFYDVPGHPLADEIVKYSSGAAVPWQAHAMVGSYLAHNRGPVAGTLFG